MSKIDTTTSSLDSVIAFTKVSFIFIRLTHKLLSKNTQLTYGSFTNSPDDAWIEELCNAVLNAAYASQRVSGAARPPTNDFHTRPWAFQTLSLSETATSTEIKSSFKSLVKTYHPDINKSPEATTKYIDIVKAYQILSAA